MLNVSRISCPAQVNLGGYGYKFMNRCREPIHRFESNTKLRSLPELAFMTFMLRLEQNL